MEEDLKGYLEWIQIAEELNGGRKIYTVQSSMGGSGGGVNSNFAGMEAAMRSTHQQSLKVELGKNKGDPVVMGLLKSTMFPLQQVLEGRLAV